jgi:CubicO group peptidase (beta-lactamase class C family)
MRLLKTLRLTWPDPLSGPLRPPAAALALLLAAFPAPASAQHVTPAQEALIQEVFEPWRDPGGPGVALAVTRNGELIYSGGWGSAQLEYGIPVTPASVFHVASVSKQFATFAVALLARDGALEWDDPVHRHLPDLPELGHPVTLRQLALHTSGVRDQWELLAMAGWRLDDVITRDQIMAMMLRQRELNFEPGSEYLYSNMGYSLLAEVVERVSGQGFGEFLEVRVFRPLGMNRTHVHDDHEMVVPGRAYSYRPSPSGGWQNAVLSYANQGATSLFTTAEDLARWIGEMEEPRVGDPVLWDEMRRAGVLESGPNAGDTVAYGLGLSVSRYRGLETVGHGGADAGFRSFLLHFPEERLGVVVMGNASTFNSGLTARAVAEVFLEDRMERPVAAASSTGDGSPAENPETERPSPPSRDELRAFEGAYWSPELEALYRVRLEEDGLVLRHHRHPPIALVPQDGDSFQGAMWFMRSVEFHRDAEGRVSGFRATGGRVRNLLFVRVEDPVFR